VITIRPFSLANLADYEQLTQHGDEGQSCYCSFWHQKWSSMDEYHLAQREEPERLKESVIAKMKGGFHVGVVAYLDDKPCAWISVGPLIDFFWAWRRVAQIGESAKNIAGIVCFTIAPEFRGQKMQAQILEALKTYAKEKEWTSIEAYPFSDEAIDLHGPKLKWAGLARGYENAGFKFTGDHWLSSPEYKRSIYAFDVFAK